MNAGPAGGPRREQILDCAATFLASAGVNSSITEIASAAGVQAGSLYHHFDSKDAILVELVKRYLGDLDAVAHDALARLDAVEPGSAREQIELLSDAISRCATRHRAALLIMLHEPPKGTDDLLARAATQSPLLLHTAMLETLRADRGQLPFRPGLDLEILADQLCRVVMHVSLGEFGEVDGAREIAAIRCRILLDGLAMDPPSNAALERSPAYGAAGRTIGELQEIDRSEVPEDDRLRTIRAVAGSAFGRRGYDATTINDIAAAAGVSKARVYRLVGSKDELLASIVEPFTVKARTGWNAVIESDSSPIEKLDALMWFNLNFVDRYRDEYHVQLACLRDAPPSTASLGVSFAERMHDLQALLADGRTTGQVSLVGSSDDMCTWALFELLWMPENLVRPLGHRGALAFARDTVLRGAARHG